MCEGAKCPVCGYGLLEVVSEPKGPVERYKCDKHGTVVIMEVLVPGAVVDLIKAFGEDPQEWLEYTILKGVEADLDAGVFQQEVLKKALKKAEGLETIISIPNV